MRKYPKSILTELQSSSLEAPGHVDHGDMPYLSWIYHVRPWRCSKKDTRNSGIGNFELLGEPRVGRGPVDALGAAVPFASLRHHPSVSRASWAQSLRISNAWRILTSGVAAQAFLQTFTKLGSRWQSSRTSHNSPNSVLLGLQSR